MPRYQVSDGGTQKYWEIAQRGERLRRWWGRHGTVGNVRTSRYDSEERAVRAYRRFIAEKTRAGYAIVGREPVEAPNVPLAQHVELEAAIAAAPDDIDAYQVYGDWLIGEGDPRGELVGLQVALHRLQAVPMPSDPDEAGAHRSQFFAHRQAVQTILETHRDHLLGDVALFASGPADSASPQRRRGLLRVAWRWGFVHRVQLEAGDYPEEGPLGLLDRLDAHPSGRFVRELSVRSPFDGSLAPAVDHLRDPSRFPHLQTLALGWEVDDPDAWDLGLGDVAELLERRPGITTLRLQGRCTASSAPLAPLRSLALRPIGDARPWLAALERDSASGLERLELSFTEPGQEPIWENLWPRLPSLRHLVLGGAIHHDPALRALMASPVGRQLEALELEGGMCRPATLAALAQVDGWSLHRLILQGLPPGPHVDALRDVFPRVVVR